MKKKLAALACAVAPILAFAEGAGSDLDYSAVTTLMTEAKTSLAGFVTAILPIVGGIALGFMVWWLVGVAIGAVKKLGNKAKS